MQTTSKCAPLAKRLKNAKPPRTSMPLAVMPIGKPAAPREASALLQRPEPFQCPPAPPGPCRIKLWLRGGKILVPEGAMAVIDFPWGCPFRIRRAAAGRKPFSVQWRPIGLGVDRPRPRWFEPINHAVRREAQEEAAAALELWLGEPEQADLVAKIQGELRGKPLACLCGPRTPCHGDVLVRVANALRTEKG
jgi:hypothetical protein